ncbi:multidrug effflux MFS transporter [Dyadobacter diqingensis]|uniref:multidrug effflux MFS transporter n=1 Tax=Dyadobacter diqingensis TaxID=2938121 RepID=UPI0020C36759|nr:multidrug effflux MFS transporter [Dyadobacter diqingensis]
MKKTAHTKIILILGGLIALSPFSIDMYLPAFSKMAVSLKTDISTIGYSLTSYYAGLCIGQLVYGVLIDRFGRKKPLIAGLVIYLIASLGCATAQSVDLLIAFRLLMALGGCVGMVAARAIVRDLFPAEATAKVLSILVLVMGIAPIIAPTVGGLVNGWLGWRWVFGVMGLIALLLLAVVYWALPETGKADMSERLRLSSFPYAYSIIIRNRIFLIYALAGGISYAGMYAYIAGSPFVFMEKYGLSEYSYAWAFALNACGLITGSQLNRWALKKIEPEKLNLCAAVLLVVVSTGLLGFNIIDMAGPALTLWFTFMFLFCLGFINPNTTAIALRQFDSSAGKASAVLGSLQMMAGVVASWFVSFLHNGTTVIMPAVMFGCAVLTLGLLSQTAVDSKVAWLLNNRQTKVH